MIAQSPQRPISRGIRVAGTPTISAHKASNAIGFFRAFEKRRASGACGVRPRVDRSKPKGASSRDKETEGIWNTTRPPKRGRSTGASDTYHTLAWSYDGLGRVTGKGQTVAGVTLSVGYSYTNGDMVTLVTPSRQTITYSYSNHQISSITVNGATLLSSVTYDPFGPVNGWTWGNNTTVSRAYDEDGNPNSFVTAGVTNSYTVDYASRITGISDSGLSSNSWTFGYDALDRVTSGSSSALSRGYTYDADGNVQSETGTVAFTATVSTSSNEISSITGGVSRAYSYDDAGNITGDGTNSYTFNQRGRMISANGTSYIYNALGQLIEKSGSSTTILMYDEKGHLTGEYTGTGALIEETVWMGDTPVATLQPNGSGISVYYIHSDHLNTPRKITRPSDNSLMWRWDPDTFGSLQPNSNPSGNGTFSYNLRFAGQYYQAETGLNYSYFRDYDPQTGRYLESDPLGLIGGLSTYAYVLNRPTQAFDPLGLQNEELPGAEESEEEREENLPFSLLLEAEAAQLMSQIRQLDPTYGEALPPGYRRTQSDIEDLRAHLRQLQNPGGRPTSLTRGRGKLPHLMR